MAEARDASEVGTTSGPTSCLRCGYDLQGLDGQTACPECGLLVALSRLDGRELRHNHPRWLLKLGIGARLTALGMFLYPVTLLSMQWILEWGWVRDRKRWMLRPGAVRPSITIAEYLDLAWRVLAAATPAFVFLVGVCLLCVGSGRSKTDAVGRGSRRVIIALSFVLFVPTLLAVATALRWHEYFGISGRDVDKALLLLYSLSLVLPILIAYHLRRLARRAPAPHLATDSPAVAWILSVCMGLPLLDYLFSSGPLYTRISGHAKFQVIVIWTSVVLTAYLWSVFILVRYGWAFSRARKQALSLFKDADFADPRARPAHEPLNGPSPSQV